MIPLVNPVLALFIGARGHRDDAVVFVGTNTLARDTPRSRRCEEQGAPRRPHLTCSDEIGRVEETGNVEEDIRAQSHRVGGVVVVDAGTGSGG